MRRRGKSHSRRREDVHDVDPADLAGEVNRFTSNEGRKSCSDGGGFAREDSGARNGLPAMINRGRRWEEGSCSVEIRGFSHEEEARAAGL